MNYCKNCNKETKNKKFCSRNCSAKVTNVGIKRNIISKLSDDYILLQFNNSSSLIDFYSKLGYSNRPTTKGMNELKNKMKELSISIDKFKKNLIQHKTKEELFNTRANWQSARSSIARHSRVIYNNSDKPKECLKCKYNTHIEIAHIKSVSDFNEESSILEINHIDNLIALCPNHHWELDNGFLNINDILSKN